MCVPWSVKCGACSGTLALGTYSNGLKHPTNRAPKPCLPVAATNSVERQRSLLAISSSPRGAPRRALSGRNRKQVHIYLSLGVIHCIVCGARSTHFLLTCLPKSSTFSFPMLLEGHRHRRRKRSWEAFNPSGYCFK